MTTAHRPTWNAAVGGSEQGGSKMYVPSRQYSAKDLPGQTKMKERPQIDIDPKSNQYRAELLRREEEALAKKERREARNLDDKNQGPEAPDLKEIEPELSKKQKKDSDDESEDAPRHKKKSRDDYANPFPEDEDDEDFMKSDDEKSESSSSKKSEDKDDDDDSDSDNERLLLEYERVKKEREEEQKRKERERLEALETQRKDEIMNANPLINNLEYSLKKKWFEDTVFKNQSKTEPKDKKRFINDTVRSDFHKKFLNKYIFN